MAIADTSARFRRIEWYERNVVWRVRSGRQGRYASLGRSPSASPSDDPEGTPSPFHAQSALAYGHTDWKSIHEQVQAAMEEEERLEAEADARREAEQRELRRREALRTYFDRLRKEQKKGHESFTFPPFYSFLEREAVQPLWKPEDSQDSSLQDSREAALDDIKQDVDEYRKARRIEAIRIILSATDGVPLSSLSKDSADYDEQEYDEDFFNKATSLFYDRHHDEWNSFPKCLIPTRRYAWQSPYEYETSLSALISCRHILVVRAILKAARLDEDTATLNDLEDIGYNLQWPEHPKAQFRSRFFNPQALVSPPASASVTRSR